jgi:hypothetical protein
LPETQAVFGRSSKRRSHWFYVTALHETEERAAIAFKESNALNQQAAMLVELRCGPGGALGPPSAMPEALPPSNGRNGHSTWVLSVMFSRSSATGGLVWCIRALLSTKTTRQRILQLDESLAPTAESQACWSTHGSGEERAAWQGRS